MYEPEFLDPDRLPESIESELKKAPASQMDIMFIRQNQHKLREDVYKMFSKFNIIKVKNGGGRERPFNRNDFEQWVYDRLSWKGVWTKLAAIIGTFVAILQIISMILILSGKR